MRLPRVSLERHQATAVAQQVYEIVDIVPVQALLAVQHRLHSLRILEHNVEARAQPESEHGSVFVEEDVNDLQVVCNG